MLHFLLGIAGNIPFVGGFIAVFEREYYQRKRTLERILPGEPGFFEVMEGFHWLKKDLLYGYPGVAIGGSVIVWLIIR